MDKPKVTRNVIHIISRHSNWPAAGINKTFKDYVYADKANWAKFIDVVLLSVGAAFCLAGVIFFFAYNWADLHKFAKLGIVQGLIVIAVAASLFLKQPLVKNLLLSTAAILTGVLFAVFGQIYQTGADSYDFFLGWTVFITLWALASNFAPLWLIWLVLVNITLIFFQKQVANHWDDSSYFLIMGALNTVAIVLIKVLHNVGKITEYHWLNNIVSLGAAGWLTIGICAGIDMRDSNITFWLLVLFCVSAYGAAIYNGVKKRQLFYFCVVALSMLVIFIALVVKYVEFDSSLPFLMIGVFVVAYIGIIVKLLLKLKKHWDGNK